MDLLGTWKTAYLNSFSNMLDDIKNANGSDHTFESGTIDGLMKAMVENQGCIVGLFDEFSTFNDSLDKGGNGSSEKSRFLTLFNGGKWSKKTKTSGDSLIERPRFNMFSFTQPFYAVKFAENNCENGFYQRFLLTIPRERGVFIEEKKMLLQRTNKEAITMKLIFENIYARCQKHEVNLKLDPEASMLYDEYHDDVVRFRLSSDCSFSSSVKSKSLGIVLRLSGVMSLLRNALQQVCSDELLSFDEIITSVDFKRSLSIVRSSVDSSIALIKNRCPSDVYNKRNPAKIRIPVPEPENCTVEYLRSHARIVRKILSKEEIAVSLITRDKLYPTNGNDTGAHIARKFLNGLVFLGLGELKDNGKTFKRNNVNIVDSENENNDDDLKTKWKTLGLL